MTTAQRSMPIDDWLAAKEADYERRYGMADPRHERFRQKVLQEKERRAEVQCKVAGCAKPRREGKTMCDEHQKAYQNDAYEKRKQRAGKASKPPVAQPVAVTTAQRGVGLTDLIDLIPRIRGFVDDAEARAYVHGFFDGRRDAVELEGGVEWR